MSRAPQTPVATSLTVSEHNLYARRKAVAFLDEWKATRGIYWEASPAHDPGGADPQVVFLAVGSADDIVALADAWLSVDEGMVALVDVDHGELADAMALAWAGVDGRDGVIAVSGPDTQVMAFVSAAGGFAPDDREPGDA